MTAILSPEVYPFTVSAGVMLGLVLAEGMSLFVGASVSGLVDHALHLDQGSDADADGPGMGVLNWFNLGGIPFLALVILFTASFAIFGYAIQGLAGLAGGPLPTWAASAVALAGAVPATRRASRTVGRLVPRDESYAVGLADFVGRTGKVMVGPLDQGLPGRARQPPHPPRSRRGRPAAHRAWGTRPRRGPRGPRLHRRPGPGRAARLIHPTRETTRVE
jgi:membrane protein implicated in regulation of membrane protease activity